MRNQGNETMSLVQMTPTYAAELLELNTHNRSLQASTVNRYARAMARGDWSTTSPPIMVNGDTLVDGQHRLHAVIEADTTVSMWIMEGAELSAQVHIDTGAKRSFGDVLKMFRGVSEHTSTAALTTRCFMFQHDRGSLSRNTNLVPGPNEMLDWYDDHREALDAATIDARRVSDSTKLNRTNLGLIGFACHHNGDAELIDAFDEFCDALVTGSTPLGDGARALREWHYGQLALPSHSRVGHANSLGYYLVAWNRYITGDTDVRMLKMPRSRKGDRAARVPVLGLDGLPILPFKTKENSK